MKRSRVIPGLDYPRIGRIEELTATEARVADRKLLMPVSLPHEGGGRR